MVFLPAGFDPHPPACVFRRCFLFGCAALSKPKLPGSSTCSFLALRRDLFLCHTSPNSTPTFGLVLIYTLKYPCLHYHMYIKTGGTGKGKFVRWPSNSKPARKHSFSHVAENNRCTFDFKVINSTDIFQPYLYHCRRTQQETGLVN